MIHDVDGTVSELLKRELPKPLADQIEVSFATPDDQFPPQSVKLPAVDFFLYDVRENLELRSNEVQIERRTDGTAIRRPPPLRVDFSYLVTAWPSENAVPDPAQDEHRLLGAVMQVLLRYRTIPAELLQGSLVDQQPLLPTSCLQPGRLQSLGEFWQALGGKPKAALNYQVTVSVQAQPPEEVTLVTETVLKMRAKRGERGNVG